MNPVTMASTYCLVAKSKLAVGSCVTVTEVNPSNIAAVPPRETEVLPNVTLLLVKLELAIADSVLDEPLIVLLVSVWVSVVPTTTPAGPDTFSQTKVEELY